MRGEASLEHRGSKENAINGCLLAHARDGPIAHTITTGPAREKARAKAKEKEKVKEKEKARKEKAKARANLAKAKVRTKATARVPGRAVQAPREDGDPPAPPRQAFRTSPLAVLILLAIATNPRAHATIGIPVHACT